LIAKNPRMIFASCSRQKSPAPRILDQATRNAPSDFFAPFSVDRRGARESRAVGLCDGERLHATRLPSSVADSLSAGRRSGATCAIGWPLWSEGGMEVDAATKTLVLGQTGLAALPTAAGLEAFYRCLTALSPHAWLWCTVEQACCGENGGWNGSAEKSIVRAVALPAYAGPL